MSTVGAICLLSGAAGFLAVLYLRVKDNLKKVPNIDHKAETVTRMKLLLIPGILVSVPIGFWGLLVTPCLFVSYWGTLFDGFFGLSRHRGFWDSGTEDGDLDSETDNFFQAIPLWAHMSIKLGSVLLTTLIYMLCATR